MSDLDIYTVGWICALPTEHVAALKMLDERHGTPQQLSPGDTNDYSLGRIGAHNVVIATLPLGEYGTASAAMVATNVQNSFPNARIGLMVGIGGGVPSDTHDIRLGDVVVSTPINGQGGVFQYDFGKTMQDKSFQWTRHLNQPPVSLRTALSGIKAQYESEGHQLGESIQAILQKSERLIPKYQKPPPESDRLFKSRVSHDVSCLASCSSNPGNHVEREARGPYAGDPAIHYGLIASGNQLMKNAPVRDQLATEKDVLCFEMEAAGLMNHFPCLVIRGICDYSDSHKNDEWQGYAALAAAAFAKDLLSRIPTSRVEEERRIKDILSEVHSTLSNTSHNVQTIQSNLHRQTEEAVLEWITPIEHGCYQSVHRRSHEAATGTWFLKSPTFRTWIKTENQTLFCPGMPGAGKTVLASTVIDHLLECFRDQQNIGVCFIYCDYRLQSEQSTQSLLATLLKQLSRQQSSLPDDVESLHKRHKTLKTQPTLREISDTLQSVLESFSRVFIVVDALDECQVSNGTRSELVDHLLALRKSRKTSILATSRHNPAIEEKFAGSLRIEVRATSKDVKMYIDGFMHKLPQFVHSEPNLQEEIKTEIVRLVQGMFLLARLHLESLVGKVSIRNLRNALSKLPSGSDAYSHAYEDAMTRIKRQPKDQKELAEKTLLWLTHAKRPLNIEELRHALAVEKNDRELDLKNLSSAEDIVSCCAGLVTVDGKIGLASLVHYTTKEYFTRTSSHWFPDAEVVITTTCLTYLLFRSFEGMYLERVGHKGDLFSSYPLYAYAACFWGHHAERAPESESLVVEFLSNSTAIVPAIQVFEASAPFSWYRGPRTWLTPKSGLHLAVMLQNMEMVSSLIKKGFDLDPEDMGGRTPLMLALTMDNHWLIDREPLLRRSWVDFESRLKIVPDKLERAAHLGTPLNVSIYRGPVGMVKLLLDHGACPDGNKAIDPPDTLCRAVRQLELVKVDLLLQSGATYPIPNFDLYPLCVAGHSGRSSLVELLLERLVQNGIKDQDYQSPGRESGNWFRMPLSWAAKYGLQLKAEQLIANGADVDGHETAPSRMPLFLAASGNHASVVKLLLEVRTKAKKPTADDDSPLAIYAAQTSAIDILDYFLQWGIGPEIKDDVCGRSLLSWAAGCGSEAAVRLLLERDASITSVDASDQTPLWWATISGKRKNVDIIRSRGARVDVSDHRGRSALLRAAQDGRQHVVQCLVDAGVRLDWKDKECLELLSVAKEDGRDDIMERVLSTDPDLESTDRHGRTALLWAAANANLSLVALLLRRRVNIEAADVDRRTALSWSAGEGHEAVVQVLLNAKANTLSRDHRGWTPLWHAMSGTHVKVAQALSAPQYKVLWTDDEGVSLLHHVVWECRRRREQASLEPQSPFILSGQIQILVKRGLDINQKDGNGRTMLIQAAEKGDLNLLNALILSHADRNIADHFGRTACALAACNGHTGVLSCLLRHGVKVDAVDKHGRTPLSWGAWKGQLEAVRLLLYYKADVNYVDPSGRTPLWYASLEDHTEVIEFLKGAGAQDEGIVAVT